MISRFVTLRCRAKVWGISLECTRRSADEVYTVTANLSGGCQSWGSRNLAETERDLSEAIALVNAEHNAKHLGEHI
jgi:hypothetical protein